MTAIDLMRRSVQSYVEISLFSLDKSGSPAAVNNTSLSFGIRDKKPQDRVRNEESCEASNSGCNVAACRCLAASENSY
jgi:hypothetical protein